MKLWCKKKRRVISPEEAEKFHCVAYNGSRGCKSLTKKRAGKRKKRN